MDKRQIIVLADENKENLTAGMYILKRNYDVYPTISAAGLFETLNYVVPDLILLDIGMADTNGNNVMRILKRDLRFSDLPVIIMTVKDDEASEYEGLSLGAVDLITKPFSMLVMQKRIENNLAIIDQHNELKNYSDNLQDIIKEKTKQMVALQNAVLGALADMVEVRDSMTGGHVARTRKYLELMINQLFEDHVYQEEITTWDLDNIYQSAQLHDVGKIAISDNILNKPGKLTVDEFNEMKRHTAVGVEAIRKIEHNMMHDSFIRHARAIAGTHHERWDGTGYPAGLRGMEIPLEGRLMAIADVYDALISPRPYKKPFSNIEAERIITSGSGSHFDPVLVSIFQKVAMQFAQVASGDK